VADLEASRAQECSLDGDELVSIYKTMLRIRLFEERVADLLEAKEICTATHLYIGQEAVAAGICVALRIDDFIWGNHRSHGHYLAKGGDMNALMAELMCRTTGCSKGRGGSMHLFAKEVGILGTVPMVASTIPIGVGAALASAITGSDRVSVAFFGDGATEEGVFHESLNFASLKKLPVIFVCENNQYSSHLRLAARRPAPNLANFGAAYNVPSTQVDGNDVQAIYMAAHQAVDRARAGNGPTLLECLTYRWRGHVGPGFDLDLGIRDRAELESWMARCPIKHMEGVLLEKHGIAPQQLADAKLSVTNEVERAVEFARRSPVPDPSEMPRHVFVDQGGMS